MIRALLILIVLPLWAEQVGVIYSRETGRIRSFALAHPNPASLPHAKCEGLLVLDVPSGGGLDRLQQMVSAKTGKTPASDRYAVVDNSGAVTAAILADPVGCKDSIAGHDLIAHPRAAPGWKYDKTSKRFKDEKGNDVP